MAMNVTCFLMCFRIDYVLEMNNKNSVDETSNLVHAMKISNSAKQNSKPHQYIFGTSLMQSLSAASYHHDQNLNVPAHTDLVNI
jgi:hypothetical protein